MICNDFEKIQVILINLINLLFFKINQIHFSFLLFFAYFPINHFLSLTYSSLLKWIFIFEFFHDKGIPRTNYILKYVKSTKYVKRVNFDILTSLGELILKKNTFLNVITIVIS